MQQEEQGVRSGGRETGGDFTGNEGGGETGVLNAAGAQGADTRPSPDGPGQLVSASAPAGPGGMKVLKPLPHAVLDYAWAGTMMAAPWLFGFSRNKTAKTNAVASGAAILGLSLMTRYPLGAVKLVPFPVHGVVEAAAGAMTAGAPWLMGFSRNKGAKWTHLISGLVTLAVVAVTDYKAAERAGGHESSGGRAPDGGAWRE